ncbi:MAG: DinB family protein [Gemmatimonadota bacterium]
MPIADLLLPEFDNEIRVTRTVLERVPDGKGEWKPHEKSFPMGHLAQLVARLPGWVAMVTEKDELDIMPKDGPKHPGYSIETTATLLAEFDKNATAGREAIARMTDERFEEPWHFKRAGVAMFTQSKYQALRGSVLNHLVHHRAQLGLYLRLVGEKVPQMYGPTADEGKPPSA